MINENRRIESELKKNLDNFNIVYDFVLNTKLDPFPEVRVCNQEDFSQLLVEEAKNEPDFNTFNMHKKQRLIDDAIDDAREYYLSQGGMWLANTNRVVLIESVLENFENKEDRLAYAMHIFMHELAHTYQHRYFRNFRAQTSNSSSNFILKSVMEGNAEYISHMLPRYSNKKQDNQDLMPEDDLDFLFSSVTKNQYNSLIKLIQDEKAGLMGDFGFSSKDRIQYKIGFFYMKHLHKTGTPFEKLVESLVNPPRNCKDLLEPVLPYFKVE